MQARLLPDLAAIETTRTALEAAIRREDWVTVGRAHGELRTGIADLARQLALTAESMTPGSLELIRGRIAQVVADHRRLTDELVAVRDSVAGELRQARTGRRASGHYLETEGAELT
jgi:hypothetical protein